MILFFFLLLLLGLVIRMWSEKRKRMTSWALLSVVELSLQGFSWRNLRCLLRRGTRSARSNLLYLERS